MQSVPLHVPPLHCEFAVHDCPHADGARTLMLREANAVYPSLCSSETTYSPIGYEERKISALKRARARYKKNGD
jgi:hypothetical protein